jgi:ATP/maltotriose-dependent transcriptional regulator MalT
VMANLHSIDGDAELAIAELKEAQDLVLELRATDDASYTAARLAMMRARNGDVAGARAGILEVLETLQTGSAHVEAYATFSLGVLDRYEGDLVLARRRHEDALAFVSANTFAAPQVAAAIHTGLAGLDVAEGDLDAAPVRLREAWRLAMAAKDMPVAAVVAIGVAGLALARDQPVLAAEMLGAAAGLRGGEDVGDPDLQGVHEKIVAAIGEAATRSAWSRGKARSRDAAFDLITHEIAG